MSEAEIDKIIKQFAKDSLPENVVIIPNCIVVDGQVLTKEGNRVPIELYGNFTLIQQAEVKS